MKKIIGEKYDFFLGAKAYERSTEISAILKSALSRIQCIYKIILQYIDLNLYITKQDKM
jgi:hypothetical protein